MFSSVALVFEQDMRKASAIRQRMSPCVEWVAHSDRVPVVAETIRADSETWSDAILGYARI
jgi:hypothetical protein